MAVLYGGDAGRSPGDLQLAMMFLYANDYLSGWRREDSRPLTDLERMVAELCRVARFNKHPDPLRELVRAEAVFRQSPQSGPLSERKTMAELEQMAFFGRSFHEYFETMVVPLAFISRQWGTQDCQGRYIGPVIEPATWMRDTKLPANTAQPMLEALALTRDKAKVEIKKSLRKDGLPHAPSLFVRTPFLQAEDGRLIATSPWMVREHLKGGLWGRLMNAAKAKLGSADLWTRAFGQMFELACRELSLEASKLEEFGSRLLLSKGVGSFDELEDIVLLDSGGVALLSAKSRLVRESIARQAESRSELLDWYDEFLFAEKTKNYKPGAIKLLESKIRLIREGKVAAVPRNAEVFPVLVTFDDLCENPALHEWIAQRCKTTEVLQGIGVHPLTLATLEDLESLLALTSRGFMITELLKEKVSGKNRADSLRDVLVRHSPALAEHRLPFLAERFECLADATGKLLFESATSSASTANPG
jgi:hypothetical protein